jgi:hypothetical protein
MRSLIRLLGLAALVALAACNPKPHPSPASRLPEAFNQVVVLNPDRLVIDGKKVQLANAVAPNTIPGARCWSEAMAAKQGRRVVREMVFAARDIEVRDTGRRDADDRSIALVTLDGVDLGENLLQLGLATKPSGRRFDWCAPLSTRMADGPSLAALSDLNP